mmetsp:Transcript_41483/g.42265  ORF Transcript_41483/g.42265 Transcript_41483/m.42265 type:complete len:261 (+) Transcript_41483:219-1001(+)
MSGSELAKFVAVAIKDYTCANMQEEHAKEIKHLQSENSSLKEQIEKKILVQVTGPNGVPIYFEKSLNDRSKNNIRFDKEHRGTNKYIVDFSEGDGSRFFGRTGILIPIGSIVGLEFRLGGDVIQRFDTNTITGFPDDNNRKRNYIEFRRKHVDQQLSNIGARLLTQHELQLQRHGQMDLSEFIANYMQYEWVEIMSLTFDRRDIGGSLSLCSYAIEESIPIQKIKTKKISIFANYWPIFIMFCFFLFGIEYNAIKQARSN